MGSRSTGKPQIASAFIGGVFPIVSVIISGLFLFIVEKDKQQIAPTQTAVAATQVAVAATQTTIAIKSSPQPTPTPVPSITITKPKNGEYVGGVTDVSGTSSNIPKGAVIWILTMQPVSGERRFWPQIVTDSPFGAITPLATGDWSGKAYFEKQDGNPTYEIRAVIADSTLSKYLESYIVANTRRTPIPILGFPPSEPPPFRQFIKWDNISVTVKNN